MNINFTYKSLAHTEQLEAYARKRLTKIEEFLGHEHGPFTLHVTLTGHPDHAHQEVGLHISGPHYDFDARREGPHIEQLIDEVVALVYADLHKAKDRRVSNRGGKDAQRRS